MTEYTKNEKHSLVYTMNELINYISYDLENIKELVDKGENKDTIIESLDEIIDNLGI